MLVPEQVFVIISVVAVNTIATVAKLHFILLHGLVSDLNATIGGMTAKLGLLMFLSIALLWQIHHHHHHLPLLRHLQVDHQAHTVLHILVLDRQTYVYQPILRGKRRKRQEELQV